MAKDTWALKIYNTPVGDGDYSTVNSEYIKNNVPQELRNKVLPPLFGNINTPEDIHYKGKKAKYNYDERAGFSVLGIDKSKDMTKQERIEDLSRAIKRFISTYNTGVKPLALVKGAKGVSVNEAEKAGFEPDITVEEPEQEHLKKHLTPVEMTDGYNPDIAMLKEQVAEDTDENKHRAVFRTLRKLGVSPRELSDMLKTARKMSGKSAIDVLSGNESPSKSMRQRDVFETEKAVSRALARTIANDVATDFVNRNPNDIDSDERIKNVKRFGTL